MEKDLELPQKKSVIVEPRVRAADEWAAPEPYREPLTALSEFLEADLKAELQEAYALAERAGLALEVAQSRA